MLLAQCDQLLMPVEGLYCALLLLGDAVEASSDFDYLEGSPGGLLHLGELSHGSFHEFVLSVFEVLESGVDVGAEGGVVDELLV